MPVLTFARLDPWLWVSFVNTRFLDHGEWADRLGSYPDFVRWLVDQGLIDPGMAASLTVDWDGTLEATRLLTRGGTLRRELTRMAGQLRSGHRVDPVIVDLINATLATAPGMIRFALSGRGTEETIAIDPTPTGLLYPIALTAGRSLARPDRLLIKKCANEACSLLFVDQTRNHSRRWCAMSPCGNQSKARAYYRRRRAAFEGT